MTKDFIMNEVIGTFCEKCRNAFCICNSVNIAVEMSKLRDENKYLRHKLETYRRDS